MTVALPSSIVVCVVTSIFPRTWLRYVRVFGCRISVCRP